MLYDFVGTSVRDCFIRAVLIGTLGVVGGSCGESDGERCGERPEGPEYPANSSYSDCGVSVCGAFYDYICQPDATSWTTIIVDCNCYTEPPDPARLCNPVTQLGCASGEKCGSLVLTESPLASQVACVPDGDRALGESCSDGKSGQATGYDNCAAGYDCFQSQCRAICDRAADSCDGTTQSDGSLGEACADHVGEHLGDDAGVCLPKCVPSQETISDGIIQNPSCEPDVIGISNDGLWGRDFGSGQDAKQQEYRGIPMLSNAAMGQKTELETVKTSCWGHLRTCSLDPSTGDSTCSESPPGAALATQNHAPTRPPDGSEFPSSCAPGFSDLLASQNNPNGSPQCARYCTPEDTYLDSAGVTGNTQGLNSQCETGNLDMVGGRNSHDVEHQCRHIQTLVPDANSVSEEIGMCVPVVPVDKGSLVLENGARVPDSFGDCSLFDWPGLKEAWNNAAPNGLIAAQLAFDNFCLTTPDNPGNAQIYTKCQGFFFGCVHSDTLSELAIPAGA